MKKSMKKSMKSITTSHNLSYTAFSNNFLIVQELVHRNGLGPHHLRLPVFENAY